MYDKYPSVKTSFKSLFWIILQLNLQNLDYMDKSVISVEGNEIRITEKEGKAFISLTDIARRSNTRTEIVI